MDNNNNKNNNNNNKNNNNNNNNLKAVGCDLIVISLIIFLVTNLETFL